ncbi:MAG: DUF945 family protein [Pseudomonadota bacterium]
MNRSARLLQRAAWPLWGLLLLILIGLFAPRQIGRLAEQSAPVVLAELARPGQGQLRQEAWQRGWWGSEAHFVYTHPLLREPIPLGAEMHHGPWLGSQLGLGWFAARIPLPVQGGFTAFPAEERMEAELVIDLFGQRTITLWRLRAGQRIRTGRFRLPHDNRELVGETELPGVLLKLQQGDLRLAEINLRARLTREASRWRGTLGLDARRAGLGQGEHGWLIEQPRAELTLGEIDQLTLHWSASQGIHTLGPLETRLRWHGVDWSALRASLGGRLPRLNNPQRLRQQLERFSLAIETGEILLDTLRLETPLGKLHAAGMLRGRNDAPAGWQRLHAELRLSMDRALMLQAFRASRWVDNERAATHLLDTLREQQLISGEDNVHASLSLWEGALTVSGRVMPIDTLLGGEP